MNVMNLDVYNIEKQNYVVYENIFTYDQCNDILEKQKDRDIIVSEVDNPIRKNFKNHKELYSYEKCVIEDVELEENLIKYIFDCNSKVFGYEIWGIESDLEILTFKKGDFFEYHENILWYSSEPNSRKLTGYLFLTDMDQYQGGTVDFDSSIQIRQIPEQKCNKGNLLIIPSFLSINIGKVEDGYLQILKFDIIGPSLR